MNSERILVTGASGFVACHLIPSLLQNNSKARILGISRHKPSQNFPSQFTWKKADLINFKALKSVIRSFKPTQIYHLAGMSSVADSFENPGRVFRSNAEGSINLLEALKQLSLKPKVLLVSTGQVYGKTFQKKIAPSETDLAYPMSPYALSKLMMEEAGKYYFKNYQIPVYITRSFNHFGFGQSPDFSIMSFVQQFATFRQGQMNGLQVGNIDVSRDFSDVRDIVRGYQVILKKGKPGDIYNIGSGRAISLRKVIQMLKEFSSFKTKIISNRPKRSLDIKAMQANIQKARRSLGCTPRHSFEETLKGLYRFYQRKA